MGFRRYVRSRWGGGSKALRIDAGTAAYSSSAAELSSLMVLLVRDTSHKKTKQKNAFFSNVLLLWDRLDVNVFNAYIYCN